MNITLANLHKAPQGAIVSAAQHIADRRKANRKEMPGIYGSGPNAKEKRFRESGAYIDALALCHETLRALIDLREAPVLESGWLGEESLS